MLLLFPPTAIAKCRSAPETRLYHQELLNTYSTQMKENTHQACGRYYEEGLEIQAICSGNAP